VFRDVQEISEIHLISGDVPCSFTGRKNSLKSEEEKENIYLARKITVIHDNSEH